MNARLIITAGPLKGTLVPLAEPRVTIGRESTNVVCLKSVKVSRKHCEIKREDESRFRIVDLGSVNGTFVNGIPLRQRWLDHNDEIMIGDSVLLFSLHDEQDHSTGQAIQFDRDRTVTQSAIELSPGTALYHKRRGFSPALHAEERLMGDLRALVVVSRAINSIRGMEELQRRLLESILTVVPAERGAILLADDSGDEFASVFGWHRDLEASRPVEVSRTIARRVLREGISILNNQPLEGHNNAAPKSLRKAGVRSVLGAPLVAFEKRFGVIYLDSRDARITFDEGHLQLLTAAAGIASIALENARQMEWLGIENLRLKADFELEHHMVGESAAIRKIHDFVAKVASTDATILIWGESGTGKELVARAIHRNSPRAQKPFVAINCAALVESLLESELFGHEKGAFTSATARKKGKLEVANGGTVLLDEIGELAPSLQAKLLRVLQEHEFERVGGTRPLRVDLRILATNGRDLKEAVRLGAFREDLYFRINVISMEMPPLRERRDDVPLLAMYFTSRKGVRCNRRISGIAPEALECLMNYDWPGNVRELENAIERAVVLAAGEVIRPEDLPETVLEAESGAGVLTTRYHEAIRVAKRKLILKALEEAKGNRRAAARSMGVHPKYLHRLIRNLNLKTKIDRQ